MYGRANRWYKDLPNLRRPDLTGTPAGDLSPLESIRQNLELIR